MVGVRVASQEVWAGLVLVVAPNYTEIIHQAGTEAGALHGDDVILTYRYDDTFSCQVTSELTLIFLKN